MKRIGMLLLACALALSLAACGGSGSGGGAGGAGGGGDRSGGNSGGAASGPASPGETSPAEGYDAEYTIYVNGSDEWTPFKGKSGVSFTVSDDKVIAVSESGTKISFTGKQVGESIITATLDGAEANALVRVREMKTFHVPARYVPLVDFLIRYDAGTGDCVYAAIGSEMVEMGTVTYPCHYVGNGRYYDDGSGWRFDDNYEDDDGEQMEFLEKLRQDSFSLYIKNFDDYFYSYRYTDPEQSISDSYVGVETVAGVECWVYECDNVSQGGTYKFWVNPQTGHCLKFIDNGELKMEIKEYDIDLTDWPKEWGIE